MYMFLEGLLLQLISDQVIKMLYQFGEWLNSYPWWSLLT